MTVMTGLEPGFGVVNDLMVMQHECLSTPEGQALGSWHGARLLPRCDNFVEQREHAGMTPRVVDMNEHDCVVTWTQGFEPKLVSRIEIMCQLVSRRNHCA